MIHFHDPEIVVGAAVCRLLGRFGPLRDVVLVFDAHELLAAQVAIKPALAGRWYAGFVGSLVRRCFPYVVAMGSDKVVAAEEEIADWLGSRSSVTLVANTVDTDLFDSQIRDAPDGVRRVVYVGSTSTERGLRTLIESMTHAIGDGLNIELRIVGSGPLDEIEMERIASQVSSEACKVEILGRLGYQESVREMVAADIGVVPFHDVEKYRRSTPTKVFEYAAAGLAIIGSDLPAVKKAIDGRPHSTLVEPGNPQALGRAIRQTLQDSGSSKSRRKAIIDSLSPEETFRRDHERLLQLYRAIYASLAC